MIPPATTTAAAPPGTTAATTEVLRPSKVEGKEGDGRSSPSSSSLCFPPSPLVFFFGRSTQSASFFLSLTPFFFGGGEGGECGICRGRRRSLTRLSSSPLPLPGRPTAFIIMLASPFSSGADFPLPLPLFCAETFDTQRPENKDLYCGGGGEGEEKVIHPSSKRRSTTVGGAGAGIERRDHYGAGRGGGPDWGVSRRQGRGWI